MRRMEIAGAGISIAEDTAIAYVGDNWADLK